MVYEKAVAWRNPGSGFFQIMACWFNGVPIMVGWQAGVFQSSKNL